MIHMYTAAHSARFNGSLLLAESAAAAINLNKDAGQSTAANIKPVDIQALMKSDPRFIARLIQQLDTQMHNMQDEKTRRQQAMKEDTEELQRTDKEISTHIQPGLVEWSFASWQPVNACVQHESVMHSKQRRNFGNVKALLSTIKFLHANLVIGRSALHHACTG